MDVTIIGAGNMGRAIGTRLVAGGNRARILAQDRSDAEALAKELEGAAEGGGGAEAGAAGDPISGGVVVLALWYEREPAALEQYGDRLEGKIIIDISNPVDDKIDRLVTPPDSSGAEELAKQAPEGAKLVKAFNTNFAATLLKGEVAGQPLDVFIASDDEGAREQVKELVRSAGLNPIDAGPLRRARELESLGLLHMAIQDDLGTGWTSAVKILS